MPASFNIRLDTAAPVITWGPVTDAIASETMTVLYLVDEPGVVSAELKLADNRVLAGVVLSDRITVDIPDDAPEGTAILTATLTDDVGNTTTATLDIQISGELAPAPPAIPTLPGPPVEVPWRTRSRCWTRSRYSVATTRRLPSRATVRTRIRVARRPGVTSPGLLSIRSGGAVRVYVGSASTLHAHEKWTLSKRPEGHEAEDELIALGIF